MKQVTGATSKRPLYTAKTLLVPREAFSLESASGLLGEREARAAAEEMLRLAGMAPEEGERVVFSDLRAPVVAVMVVSAETVDPGCLAVSAGDRKEMVVPGCSAAPEGDGKEATDGTNVPGTSSCAVPAVEAVVPGCSIVQDRKEAIGPVGREGVPPMPTSTLISGGSVVSAGDTKETVDPGCSAAPAEETKEVVSGTSSCAVSEGEIGSKYSAVTAKDIKEADPAGREDAINSVLTDGQWTTPLLAGRPSKRPCIWVFRHRELVYIKVWREKGTDEVADTRSELRLAEVLVAPRPEDLLFYIAEFSQALGLDGYKIRLQGHGVKADAKLLKRYFKRVVCE